MKKLLLICLIVIYLFSFTVVTNNTYAASDDASKLKWLDAEEKDFVNKLRAVIANIRSQIYTERGILSKGDFKDRGWQSGVYQASVAVVGSCQTISQLTSSPPKAFLGVWEAAGDFLQLAAAHESQYRQLLNASMNIAGINKLLYPIAYMWVQYYIYDTNKGLNNIEKSVYTVETTLEKRIEELAKKRQEANEFLGDFKCFIATAAYGSETAKELDTLRAFRDKVLLKNEPGKLFVDAYYGYSPPLAEFIAEHEEVRTLVREVVLNPVVFILNISQGAWNN